MRYFPGDLEKPSILSTFFNGGFIGRNSIIVGDINGDGLDNIILSVGGVVKALTGDNKTIWISENKNFQQIHGIYDIFGNGDKYILASYQGANPSIYLIDGKTGQIVFSRTGLGSCYAIASQVLDINDDNKKELILGFTSANQSANGNLIEVFGFNNEGGFSYSKLGGYNISGSYHPMIIGDIDNDNYGEIFTTDASYNWYSLSHTGSTLLGSGGPRHNSWAYYGLSYIKNPKTGKSFVLDLDAQNTNGFSVFELNKTGQNVTFTKKFQKSNTNSDFINGGYTNQIIDLFNEGNYYAIYNIKNTSSGALQTLVTEIESGDEVLNLNLSSYRGNFKGPENNFLIIGKQNSEEYSMPNYQNVDIVEVSKTFSGYLNTKFSLNGVNILNNIGYRFEQKDLNFSYSTRTNTEYINASYNIDGLAGEEIFVGRDRLNLNSGLKFEAYNYNGELILSYELPKEVSTYNMIGVYNLLSGITEKQILLSANDGNLYILNSKNGSFIKKLPNGNTVSQIISGDMNNDGKNEIAFINGLGELIVINAANSNLLNPPSIVFKKNEFKYSSYSHNIKFIDIDGDGNMELVAVEIVSSEEFRLVALNYSGNYWLNPITNKPFIHSVKKTDPEVSGINTINSWSFAISGQGKYDDGNLIDFAIRLGALYNGATGRSIILRSEELESVQDNKLKIVKNWTSQESFYDNPGYHMDVNNDGFDEFFAIANGKSHDIKNNTNYTFPISTYNPDQAFYNNINNNYFKITLLSGNPQKIYLGKKSGNNFSHISNINLYNPDTNGYRGFQPTLFKNSITGMSNVFLTNAMGELYGVSTAGETISYLWPSGGTYADGYRYFKNGKIYYSTLSGATLLDRVYINNTSEVLSGIDITNLDLGRSSILGVKNGLGNGKDVIFIGSSDGYLYAINPVNGESYWNFTNAYGDIIGQGFYIGYSLGSMGYSDQIIWTDINGNGKGELIISAGDGNIYIMNNANLSKPTAVFDGKLVGQQRSIIYSFDSPICANWDVVPNATGYLIKFYYFANGVREDIGQTVVDGGGIQFGCLNSHNGLSPNYLYRAEVIAYNNITQSQSTHSIGARVASMRIEKKVMKEGDPGYLNETTQKADDKVTYRIRIYNDSLINLQGSGENKITITDIMPKNFIFNGNIKVRNNPNLLGKNRNTFDGSGCKPNFNENYGFDFGSSISYEPGAILKWILCPSDVIPAGGMFEITFEALVR